MHLAAFAKKVCCAHVPIQQHHNPRDTHTGQKLQSWVGHTYQLRAETANLKTRLRATPDFVTFWPPLRAHEGAGKMQSLRRNRGLSARVRRQQQQRGCSARSIALGRTVPWRCQDGLEKDGAGHKEAAGRAVAVPAPAGSFEDDLLRTPRKHLCVHDCGRDICT